MHKIKSLNQYIHLPENNSGGKKRMQSSKPDVPGLPLRIVSYISFKMNMNKKTLLFRQYMLIDELIAHSDIVRCIEILSVVNSSLHFSLLVQKNIHLTTDNFLKVESGITTLSL